MVDEPRVTRLSVQIALAAGVDNTVRVTQDKAQVVFSDRTNPVRASRLQAQAVYGDRTNPVRASLFQVQILQSIGFTEDADVIDPVNPEALKRIPVREANPYKPTLPAEVEAVNPVLYDYMVEQAQLIRQQHDTTQAGDSTFGWEWMVKKGTQQLYTLGSLGRFYHDDYGILLARYVQFTQWESTDFVCCPVGRVEGNANPWIVTNDLGLSSPESVVGVFGAGTAPDEGEFGWVLTQGSNHFALRLPDDESIATSELPLVWSSTGRTSGVGKGRILGRVRGKNTKVHALQNQMDAGTIYLAVEGPSIDSLKAMLPNFDDLEARLVDLEAAAGGQQQANIQKQLTKLIADLKKLDDRESEAGVAVNERLASIDEQLTSLIAAVGDTTLAAMYARIVRERDLIDADQDRAIAKALNRADDAFTIARALQQADYQGQIDGIRATLGAQTRPIVLIPLVTGEVPPVFVYLPDGNLVFVGIES